MSDPVRPEGLDPAAAADELRECAFIAFTTDEPELGECLTRAATEIESLRTQLAESEEARATLAADLDLQGLALAGLQRELARCVGALNECRQSKAALNIEWQQQRHKLDAIRALRHLAVDEELSGPELYGELCEVLDEPAHPSEGAQL